MSTPNFMKGGAAAEEASKHSGGQFARVRYFSLKAGEQGVFRFLTDSPEWISVKQHSAVPTKNGPAEAKNWPKMVTAVCRYDAAFAGMYHDCYVDDKPIINPRSDKPITAALRTWAFAVVRKEVSPGVYEDDTIEVKYQKDGKEVVETQLNIVVVNMGMKNFFAPLQGIFTMTGSICNIDFAIKRQGEGLDTTYVIMALPPKVALSPTETPDLWKRYTDALENQNLDLGAIVAEKASDEHYRKFFDERFTYTDAKTVEVPAQGTAPAVEQAAAPTNDVAPDALAEMRARVRGYSATAAE